MADNSLDMIAHNIQLAIAPVFLLTGIASILGVLTNRLGRVIDRARKLEGEAGGYDPETRRRAAAELVWLTRRMTAAHWAIGLCTCSALFVCVVIALLFVGELVPRASTAVAPLFIFVMALLIAGLLLFLLEVQIAMRSVRVRSEMLEGGAASGN